jgi:hypothetical protein
MIAADAPRHQSMTPGMRRGAKPWSAGAFTLIVSDLLIDETEWLSTLPHNEFVHPLRSLHEAQVDRAQGWHAEGRTPDDRRFRG